MNPLIVWLRGLAGGSNHTRRVFHHLPSQRRCKECAAPFMGVFSLPFKLADIRPSRKNPNMCTICYELSPAGGELREVSVLFLDVRGYTALAETVGAEAIAGSLNHFYRLAGDAIFAEDGTLDKLLGDAVMAFFGAPVQYPDHAERAVEVALKVMRGVRALGEAALPVGGGIATGPAFVGNVGQGETKDYTALGDTVNVAARLQAAALAGELLVTENTYRAVAARYPNAPVRDLDLKGKAETVRARVLQA